MWSAILAGRRYKDASCPQRTPVSQLGHGQHFEEGSLRKMLDFAQFWFNFIRFGINT
jgi:hypothetical protein